MSYKTVKHWGRTGTAAGVSAALAAYAAVTEGCDTRGDHMLSGNWTAPLAVGMGLGVGLVGTGIGALVGAMIHSERWRVVPLEQLRVGPVGSEGILLGFKLGVR